MSYRSNCSYDSTSGSTFDPGEYSTNRRRRGKSKRRGSYKTKGACRGDDGKFVSCDARPNAGGRKRKSTKKSSKRRWDRTSESYYGARRKRRGSPSSGHKRSGKKAWPKAGSRKMGHVVAGVEARVHEDVNKALKILKSAKYRSQATAKRGGAKRAAGFGVLDKIVRELERLLTR